MRLESEPAATFRTTNSTWNMSRRLIRMAVSESLPKKWVWTPFSSSREKSLVEMALFRRPFSWMVPFFLPSKAVAESLKSWM